MFTTISQYKWCLGRLSLPLIVCWMAHALSFLFSVCLPVVIFNTSLLFCLVGSLLLKILVFCVLCCGFFSCFSTFCVSCFRCYPCLRNVPSVFCNAYFHLQFYRLIGCFIYVTYAEFDITVPNLIYLPTIGWFNKGLKLRLTWNLKIIHNWLKICAIHYWQACKTTNII